MWRCAKKNHIARANWNIVRVNDEIRVECHTWTTARKREKNGKRTQNLVKNPFLSVSLNRIPNTPKTRMHTHKYTLAHQNLIRLICSSLSGYRLEWFYGLMLHTSLTQSLCLIRSGFCIEWTSIFLCYRMQCAQCAHSTAHRSDTTVNIRNCLAHSIAAAAFAA